MDWMVRHLEKADFKISSVKRSDNMRFPCNSLFITLHLYLLFYLKFLAFFVFSYSILHSEDSILRQMKVGQSKLHLFQNAALRQGMEVYMADLT